MREVTFEGKTLHLAGRNLRIGSRTPDFKAVKKVIAVAFLKESGKPLTCEPCKRRISPLNKENDFVMADIIDQIELG